MTAPDNSAITLHDGGTSITGKDGMLYYKAITLKSSLSLFIKTGNRIIPTRGVTGPVMLRLASEFSGKTYKRGQYQQALDDLSVWIETMKAALPIEDERRPAPVTRSECSNLRMTTGGEKKHPVVIEDGTVKRWVGIGWVDERPATAADLKLFPQVKD